MSLETRHTEKNMLYNLLLAIKGNSTIEQVASNLMATMEPEDVKLVEKAIDDFLKIKKD